MLKETNEVVDQTNHRPDANINGKSVKNIFLFLRIANYKSKKMYHYFLLTDAAASAQFDSESSKPSAPLARSNSTIDLGLKNLNKKIKY